jgi:hypothetical protein
MKVRETETNAADCTSRIMTGDFDSDRDLGPIFFVIPSNAARGVTMVNGHVELLQTQQLVRHPESMGRAISQQDT